MDNYSEEIERAAEIVKRGGVILYPTDTVWGIGCDATNSDAVRRVFDIKRRADSKALIILLGDVRLIDRYVDEVPEIALELLDVVVKPTTIIYDCARGLAPEVVATDGSVAIRVTSEDFSRRLCMACRRPLVSTSANVSGEPAPDCFANISREIVDAVDYVVDARRDEPPGARPSSIIKIGADSVFKIIRK